MKNYPLLPQGRPFTPEDWELIEEKREPARGRKYRRGESIQTLYRHKRTGELMTRHRIEVEGKIVHDHLRPGGVKP